MKSRLITYSILLPASLFVLVLGTALARSPALSKSSSVDVIYHARLGNGAELQPGHYKVTVSENPNAPELMFYQDNKLVAETLVKLVDMGKKAQATEVDYNRESNQQVITGMRFGGWSEEVILPGATNTSNSGS